MDNSNLIEIQKLKDLFLKLSSVADNIKSLNDCVKFSGEYAHTRNTNVVRDAINCLPEYTHSTASKNPACAMVAQDAIDSNGFVDNGDYIINHGNGSTANHFNVGMCCSSQNHSTAGNVIRDAINCLPEYTHSTASKNPACAMVAQDAIDSNGFVDNGDYIINHGNGSTANHFNVGMCCSSQNHSTAGNVVPNGSTDMDDSIGMNSTYMTDTDDYFNNSSETNGCFNFENVMQNNVMSIPVPYDSQFNERRLQPILNGRKPDCNTTNYFYYLFDNSDLQRDVNKCLPNGPYDLKLNYDSNVLDNTTENVVRDTCVSNGTYDSIGVNETTDEEDLIDVDDSFGIMPNTVSRLSPSTAEIADIQDGNLDTPCDVQIKSHQGCDNINMYIETSDGKAKRLCCPYCHKRYPKLARHLQTVHKNEPEVKKFRSLPPRSKGRQKIIEIIRNRGRFEWNTNGTLNRNVFLTSRRQNKKFKKTAMDYLTCANCFGTFAKTVITRHWNKCTKNLMRDGRFVKALGRAVEGRLHVVASEELRTAVFPKIRDDVRIRNIRFDWLVMTYGNNLCLNYSPHYQHGYIRKKLRDCAKLLFSAKCISTNIEDFASLFHVKNCDTVIESILTVAKFNRTTKLFGSPGTASTLVTLVNTVGALLVIEQIKLDDPDSERNVERFLKVFQMEAKTKVNKLVAITQAKNRRNRNENIPTTEDVNKLALYLDVQRAECHNVLLQQYSYQKWVQLSELTLASILVFNRRRTGEMRNILVSNYRDRQIIAECDKNWDVLTDETKRLIKSRMEMRGKLDRTVAALLKHDEDDCIDTLLQHRLDAGINDKNEFLFALPSKIGVKTVDSCAVLRSFSVACGAENPSSLRGTKLRKHMASYCATKNLTDNDITNLANFLGHRDKIHRDHYRHNAMDREVQQMTFLLDAAQGRRKDSNSVDTTANPKHVKAIQTVIESDTSSDSCMDSYDEEAETPTPTPVRKRKIIRRKRQRKVEGCKKSASVNSQKTKTVKKNGKKSAATVKAGRAPKKNPKK